MKRNPSSSFMADASNKSSTVKTSLKGFSPISQTKFSESKSKSKFSVFTLKRKIEKHNENRKGFQKRLLFVRRVDKRTNNNVILPRLAV